MRLEVARLEWPRLVGTRRAGTRRAGTVRPGDLFNVEIWRSHRAQIVVEVACRAGRSFAAGRGRALEVGLAGPVSPWRALGAVVTLRPFGALGLLPGGLVELRFGRERTGCGGSVSSCRSWPCRSGAGTVVRRAVKAAACWACRAEAGLIASLSRTLVFIVREAADGVGRRGAACGGAESLCTSAVETGAVKTCALGPCAV